MNQQDIEAILGIVTLASLADGNRDASEQEKIASVASRLGLPYAEDVVTRAAAGEFELGELATRLSTEEARKTAFDAALSVCHADGTLATAELAFLQSLRGSLRLDALATDAQIGAVSAIGESAMGAAVPEAFTGPASSSGQSPKAAAELEAYILDQAILTAALEFLPDRLANLGILPLQLRLVRHIGQRHGAQAGVDQIKDLAATFGIGAAAQIMETVVRRTLGGLAGGIFGGMMGSAAGATAGGAVTFASTYALGHAAQQYYAQNRSISTSDLRALFARFQGEANTMFPRVQERVASLARENSFESLMRMVRG